MNQNQFTHGFLPGYLKPEFINIITKILKTDMMGDSANTYVSHLHIKYPELAALIPPNIMSYARIKLESDSVCLHNIELHCLPSCSSPIPPHQDNFYHCIPNGAGLKFLIPLTRLSTETGALSYLDCNSSIGILTHSPSKIKNFSAYIPDNVLNKLEYSYTSYEYLPGDASYHLLNSVHYSHGNKSHETTFFIVIRYQSSEVSESLKMIKKYKDCYLAHQEIINST